MKLTDEDKKRIAEFCFDNLGYNRTEVVSALRYQEQSTLRMTIATEAMITEGERRMKV